MAKPSQAIPGMESLVSTVRASSKSQLALAADLEGLRQDLAQLADFQARTTRRQEATEASVGGTRASLDKLLPALRTQLERFNKASSDRQRKPAARAAQETVEATQSTIADGFYVALEARFRGARSVIRERQTKYLPMIAEARKRVELFPPPEKKVPRDHPLAHFREKGGVLDLGCGRGEWLELLKENSVPALGVDQNRFFLDLCRQRGCAVDDANLLDFLRSAPDESVAAITSFHVIEHLPIPVFQEMVNHVFRILCRGGMAIFETPSPTNVLTAGLNFLLDPTHLRPVHPQFATLVLETSGFTSVRLEFMSPYDPSHQVGTPGDPLAQRFNEYFYGPQDYAAIGVKP